jgi:hypothetical protein
MRVTFGAAMEVDRMFQALVEPAGGGDISFAPRMAPEGRIVERRRSGEVGLRAIVVNGASEDVG